jgi:hypothetical protein
MAQIAAEPHLAAQVDRYLAYLHEEWEGVPLLAQEWTDWDELSRLSFAVDWPIREDRLGHLRRWADQGRLTPAQRRRFDDLLALVERHRPMLERLLAD